LGVIARFVWKTAIFGAMQLDKTESAGVAEGKEEAATLCKAWEEEKRQN
jgi:hypothetical protein